MDFPNPGQYLRGIQHQPAQQSDGAQYWGEERGCKPKKTEVVCFQNLDDDDEREMDFNFKKEDETQNADITISFSDCEDDAEARFCFVLLEL